MYSCTVLCNKDKGPYFGTEHGRDCITSGYSHKAVHIREATRCLVYSYYSFICRSTHAYQNKHSVSLPVCHRARFPGGGEATNDTPQRLTCLCACSKSLDKGQIRMWERAVNAADVFMMMDTHHSRC